MQFATYTLLIRDRLEIINAILQKLIVQQGIERFNILKNLSISHIQLLSASTIDSKKSMIKKRWRAPLEHQHSLDKISKSKSRTHQLIQLETIYTNLEKAANNIESSYGPQIIVILIMKFATLTSLLYFNVMILIR